MDLKILKTTDYELECYVVDGMPPKVGKTQRPYIHWLPEEDSNL